MPLRAGSASRSAASWQASSSAIIARIAGTAAAVATAAAVGALGRCQRPCGALTGPLGLPREALDPLVGRRDPCAQPGGLVGQLPARGFERGVALVGRLRGLAAFGERRLVAGGERLQLRQPGRLGLQIPLGQVAGGVAARQLVGQAVAPVGSPAPGLCHLCLRGAGLVQPRPRRQLGLHRRLQRRRGAGRPLGGIGRRPLQRAVLAGQPVALGAGREPCGLAGVGDPPQLSAISIDSRPVGGHGNALLDRGQIVHQPHALDRPGQRRIA